MSRSTCPLAIAAIVVASVCFLTVSADEKLDHPVRPSRPITQPKFEPTAKAVPLFDGMADGLLRCKVIANGAYDGHVLVTNQTTESLTVQFPESFVAVQVLKQFGFGNQPNQNAGANGFGQNNQQQNGGQQQSIGGVMQQPGVGANQGNGPGAGPNGAGFFSIPAEKTVKVSFVSACLEHGKADPTANSNYRLVATDAYTQDAVLQEVIRLAGLRQSSQKAIQAAVWHQANGMTWQELSAKFVYGLGATSAYFSAEELQTAKHIIQTADTTAGGAATATLALKVR